MPFGFSESGMSTYVLGVTAVQRVAEQDAGTPLVDVRRG